MLVSARISTPQHYDTMEIIALGAETCVCMVVNDQRKVDVSDTNFSTSRSLSFPQTVLTTTLRPSSEPRAHWSPISSDVAFQIGVKAMLAVKHPEPRVGVLEIEPYVPGNNTTPQGATVFKLSSNETPLGPSPDAVRSYHETTEHLAVYPDGSGAALRVSIGRAYALNPALIVCGAGSVELLNLLTHAFLGSGDEAIHTVHGFLVFRTATLSAGGRPVVVPECNYTADVDAILSAVTSRTKIVFLANPNNPTGNACAGIWPPRCYSSSMPLMPNMCVVATKIRDRAGRKR
jgi:hypothetical protein